MSTKNSIPKFAVEAARVVAGAVFVFSGFAKAVDSLGFTYKIQDYLIKFNLPELFPLAQPAAVCLLVAEFVLGAFLLLGIYRKFAAVGITLFMLFFTPFTLWVALKNPVPDCGCFGDALVIGNWETFYKNLVLLSCAILLMFGWRLITPFFALRKASFAAAFVLFFVLAFVLHNVCRLPVFDFRPYHVGANIPQKMFVDPEKADRMESILVYSKDGEEKEFTEENYPWNDSAWTFVDMRTRVVRAGEKPKIEDFAVEALYYDADAGAWAVGGDITDLMLSDPSYAFLMVSYSLEDMNERHLDRFSQVADYAAEHGYPFYCLTSSSVDGVGDWEKRHNTGFQFCHADERALKTMIRSNPGLMLLKGGTVIRKWNDADVPTKSVLSAPMEQLGISKIRDKKTSDGIKIAVIVLLFAVPLLLLKCFGRK